jgi:hypothetical protein
MVDSRPDLVIAFPLEDSRGTFDCIRRAKAKGIAVLEVGTMVPDDLAIFEELRPFRERANKCIDGVIE